MKRNHFFHILILYVVSDVYIVTCCMHVAYIMCFDKKQQTNCVAGDYHMMYIVE